MANPKQTARLRALRKLAQIHAKEFAMLLDEEYAIFGFPPVQKKTKPKIGTRSCYNTCKGKHPECAEANREYARRYGELHRRGIKMIDITK